MTMEGISFLYRYNSNNNNVVIIAYFSLSLRLENAEIGLPRQ